DVIRRMLDDQQTTEWHLEPALHHAIQLARAVRRVGERDVVGVDRQTFYKRDRIPQEDAAALACVQRSDVRLERMDCGRPVLDEVAASCAARERLETERAGAGEEVDDACAAQ